MPTQQFSTNLRCESCVAGIRPILDHDPRIKSWTADVAQPQKLLTLETTTPLSQEDVTALLKPAGYQALQEVKQDRVMPPHPEEAKPSYFPLLLILLYLLGVVFAIEWNAGHFHWERAMRHFMAGFFLIFSFFKLLNLIKFADAYSTYDILAKRSYLYALAYPFIELLLGIAFAINFDPYVTNWAALIVMGVSSIGVILSLSKGRKIQCACLGTVFQLPMSVITLVEDLLMVGMSAVMLLWM